MAGDYIVDSLVKTDTVKPAGRDVWAIATELLYAEGYALIAYGVVGLVGAWLAGPSNWAVSLRRRLAPTLRNQPWETFAVVAFSYLLLILWGPTPAMRQIWRNPRPRRPARCSEW